MTLYPLCITPCKKLNLEPLTPDERYYHHERIAIMCELSPITEEAQRQGVRDVVRFRNLQAKNLWAEKRESK